jgi:hypothetical protein
VLDSGSAPGGQAPARHKLSQSATFLAGGAQWPCEVLLGALAQAPQAPDDLVAVNTTRGWFVGARVALANVSGHGAFYTVEEVNLQARPAADLPCLAIVDDDAGSTSAMCAWFNEAGFVAHGYPSAEQLLESPLSDHDAFVVDLILAGRQSSYALIERIRSERPEVPIVVLTGQLRAGGPQAEADLANMLNTLDVLFFEKPVRPAVLCAAIRGKLSRVAAAGRAHTGA